MVGDVHRTLLYGGIFGYPSDLNNPDGERIARGGILHPSFVEGWYQRPALPDVT